MVSIKDIAEAIKMLGDVVKSTREIIEAVNDGKKFLQLNYPDAQKDFSDLIEQMEKAIEGMAAVTGVIIKFRFNVNTTFTDNTIAANDLRIFNDYLMKQYKDISKYRGNIRSLKANCEKVRGLRDDLDKRTQDHSWGSLFLLLGAKSRQRSMELHSAISNFYAEDQRMIELLQNILDLAENAIKDIEDVLGPAGTQNPYNIPQAAAMLGIYANTFREPNRQLDKLADYMNDTRISLGTIKTN